MNWEAIGAIGAIIGGVAVFVTLIYLAIQIRPVYNPAQEVEFVDEERPGVGVSVFIGVDPKTPPTLGYSTTLPDSGF